MKNLILVSLLLPFLAMAEGGNGVGNGGNSVVCYSDQSRKVISSVQAFDYWEMAREVSLPLSLELGPENWSVKRKINYFMDRLAQFDPARAKLWRAAALEIENNIDLYLGEVNLHPVNDDEARIFPTAPCYKEQFAIQLVNPQQHQKKFMISKRIYSASGTSNSARAGIILHEVIYQEALALGHRSSRHVRYLNYILSTQFLSDVNAESVQRYKSLIQESQFPLSESIPHYLESIQKLVFLIKPSVKYEELCLEWNRDFSCVEGKRIQYLSQGNLYQAEHLSFVNGEFEVKSATKLEFFEDGNIASLHDFSVGTVFLNGAKIAADPYGRLDKILGSEYYGKANFFSNGRIMQFAPLETTHVSALGTQLTCYRGANFFLHEENGAFRYCHFVHQDFPNIQFRSQQLKQVQSLTLHPSGRLASFTFSGEVHIPIAGCSKELSFSHANLDEEGHATYGFLTKREEFVFQGTTYYFGFPKTGFKNCTADYYISTPVVPTHLEKRILFYPLTGPKPSSDEVVQATNEACKDMGFDGWGSTGAQNVFVNQKETFYEPYSKVMVSVENQGVQLMAPHCSKVVIKDYSKK